MRFSTFFAAFLPEAISRRSIDHRVLLLGVVACLSVSSFPGSTCAQNVEIEPESSATSIAVSDDEAQRVEQARATVSGRIKSLETALHSIQDSAANDWLIKSYRFEYDQLKYLDIVYAQHQSLIMIVEGYESEDDAIDTEIRRFHDQQVASGEAATFTDYESLLSAIDKQKSRVKTARAELTSGETLLDVVEDRFNDFERKRRRLEEQLDDDIHGLQHKKLEREHLNLKLSCEINQASVAKQQLENKYRRARLAATEQRLQTLEFLRESMKNYVTFQQDDLDQQLDQLGRKESLLKEELTLIQEQLEQLMGEDFRNAANREDISTLERAQILDSVKVLREQLELRMTYINSTLSEIVVLQHCWGVRYSIARGECNEKQMEEALELAETFLSRFSGSTDLIEMQLAENRSSLESVTARLNVEQTRQSVAAPWFEMQFQAIEATLEQGNRRLAHIQTTETFFNRLIADIDAENGENPQTTSLSGLVASFQGWWSYEIFAVDDSPITVGKLTSAILMLVLGILFSRRLSRFIGNRLLPRLGMHKGASLAAQTIVYYALTVCFLFFTLEMLNIPLTVFTFLGGAAAIGVGFGSQTLLNNFMSGLIILGEQPVRVGDLVEIDGVQGNICHIGARSTKIRTGSNVEIIVPNSKFMELHLTNWTLSNTEIRAQVNVGVAYGSPTDRVFELLQQALDDNDLVLKSPEPIILFSDFGNDALQFQLHFWIHMRTVMDCERIESAVRRRVDQLFRENEITIAFPQRDVHLDINRPIEVNLANPNTLRMNRAA